jgi:hypothetical protein
MAGQSFPEEVAPGGVLIAPSIHSPNYVTGTSGWTVNVDGSAEFNSLTIRGTFQGTDFIINSSGIFLYSSTPALGNLIGSWTIAAGTDSFGNTYPAGITLGLSANPQMELLSNGIGQGVLQVLYNNSLYGNATLLGDINGSFAQIALGGPKNTTAGFTDQVSLVLNSSDGSSSFSNGNLFYVDKTGTSHQYAYYDGSGFHVTTGSIAGIDPTTGTSLANPAVAETWHTVSPPAGWSGTNRYKLLAEKNFACADIQLTNAGAAGNITCMTLPSGYRPQNNISLPMYMTNNAAPANQNQRMNISSAGVVSTFALPANTTGFGGTFIFPID